MATICHLSDLHVLDAGSPMRFEWIETLAHDPRWRPLLHMHRPQEALVPWAVAAHVQTLRNHPSPGTRGGLIDLVLCTGDNIDNAQSNELDAYLALIGGGSVSLSGRGGPQDAGDHSGDSPWPYWSPSSAVVDTWKPRGYPVVEDFFDRVAEPLRSPGVGLAWAGLPGNHDLLCQGTSAINQRLAAVAVGSHKGLFPIPGFEPDDALTLFVDEPDRFLTTGSRTITPEPGRQPIELTEWLERHIAAGALGYTAQHVAARSADAVIDLDRVSIVMVDTNHPAADYQGSVGAAQLEWLDETLSRIGDDPGRLAVIASHHGVDSLVNTRGNDPSRRHGEAMLEVIHRHPCVVAWLVGHRHIHRVTPRPGPSGGFWEITTASIIDWPVERRILEIVRHDGGLVEIISTVDRHDAEPGSLAALHLDLAERFGGSQVRTAMAGSELDRDVRLYLNRPRVAHHSPSR